MPIGKHITQLTCKKDLATLSPQAKVQGLQKVYLYLFHC